MCNHSKFVDSHLKPYRCKVEGCQNARFSSTACLLRHEREAHAMHGHGEKPYLCHYDGCDRAKSGNGFPRQWNLRDHMRRVHNDNGPPPDMASSPPVTLGSSASGRGRKRKTDVPEKTPTQEKAPRKSKSGAEWGSSKAKPAKSQAAMDTELWHQHLQAVQGLVQGFAQPMNPDFLQQVTDAQQYLAAMDKLSRKLAASGGDHGWKRSG